MGTSLKVSLTMGNPKSHDNRSETKFLKRKGKYLFLIGLILLMVSLLLYLAFGQELHPALRKNILSLIAADLFAGRAGSISLGLQLGITPLQIIVTLVIFNTIYLLVLYPPILYSFQSLLRLKFIGKLLDSVKQTTERYQLKFEKWGVIGLTLFVWLPLYSTGLMVGALIGTLLGMRIVVVIPTVLISMIISVVSWVFIFDYMLDFAAGTGKILPSIIVMLLFAGALLHRLRLLKRKPKGSSG